MSSKRKVLINLPLFPFGNNKFVSLHFFFKLAAPYCLWNLISPTRD